MSKTSAIGLAEGTPKACLLFDFDHTLFDSDEAERLAFADTMAAAGVAYPDTKDFAAYVRINKALWRRVEEGELLPSEVASLRFVEFFEERGIDAPPVEMSERFRVGLAENGDLYPGVRAMLADLGERFSLAVVTNALSSVQRRRMERCDILGVFDSIVISEEVGIIKPNPAIFAVALRELNSTADAAVMVGDSLTSDIAGGSAAGIETVWANFAAHPLPHDPVAVPNHEVHSVEQLHRLLATYGPA